MAMCQDDLSGIVLKSPGRFASGRNVVDEVGHGHEKVKKPNDCQQLATSSHRVWVYNLPPASISICIVPLLLKVFRLRTIKAR